MNNVSDLLKNFEHTYFRHREELLTELNSGQTTFYSHTLADVHQLPAKHYLAIYQQRAKHVQKFTTEHAVSLRNDLVALCQELKKTPEEFVQIWSFSKLPYFNYAVFVGASNHQIFGCILAVDDRLIDDETRIQLWGKPEYI